jgi:hypothetical protein
MEISDAIWSYSFAVRVNSQTVAKHHINGDASGVSAWPSWRVRRFLTSLRAYALCNENGGCRDVEVITGRSHPVREFSECVAGASLSFVAIGVRKKAETGVSAT